MKPIDAKRFQRMVCTAEITDKQRSLRKQTKWFCIGNTHSQLSGTGLKYIWCSV